MSHPQSQKLIQKGFFPSDGVLFSSDHFAQTSLYTSSLYLPVSIVCKISIAGFHLGERKKIIFISKVSLKTLISLQILRTIFEALAELENRSCSVSKLSTVDLAD